MVSFKGRAGFVSGAAAFSSGIRTDSPYMIRKHSLSLPPTKVWATEPVLGRIRDAGYGRNDFVTAILIGPRNRLMASASKLLERRNRIETQSVAMPEGIIRAGGSSLRSPA